MAGSFDHCLTEDGEHYRGCDTLENIGDMKEAVEQMVFMLLTIRHRWGGSNVIQELESRYYACLRGELPWPEFMKPGIEND